MQDVEEQILSYPHLPVEKQREVEAYVEAHPEWAPLLRDVRAIESLVRKPDRGRAGTSFLATYLVVQHLHPEDPSPALRDAIRRFEEKLESDAALCDQVEAARRRLEEAEAAVDPVSQFESLTGHALEPDSTPTESAEPARETASERESAGGIQALLDELLRLPVGARWAGAAIAVLLGAYVVLFAASEASTSTLDRLAAVEISDQVVENYATADMRSPAPEADTLSVDDRYLEALSALRSARVSTLGLFPRYDSDALARAEKQLDRVLAQVEPGSFLALEAHFYLGKIALAQEEVDAARGHLKAVVKGESRRAKEAYEILKTLQQERGVGGE